MATPRDSSQQDRPEQADRREVQNERVSKLERGRRVAAQLQESRDMLLDGTPEQKVPSTGTRNANQFPAASPGRVRQTHVVTLDENDDQMIFQTAAHASVDSWGEMRTRLDYVLGYTQHQEYGSD